MKVFSSTGAPAELIAKISGARRILISGHVRPDGDSLGSMIALARALTAAGKSAFAVVKTRRGLGAPSFLPGVRQLLTVEAAARKRFDLFIAVDCASIERLPDGVGELVGKIPASVAIDHHQTNGGFADLNWVRPHASSCGEMTWSLIRAARWPMDAETAEALWVAVVTDSGRFAYDSTSPLTMRCGADLIRHGARTAYVNDRIYCSFSEVAVELKRRAYQTLKRRGDVAWVTLTTRDFQETGGTKSDAEDAVEIPRSLAGNKVALFFYGVEEGELPETRVSIRTREALDASAFAARFGGGGHVKAAGCTVKLPLRKAIALVLKDLALWRKEEK